MAEVLSQQEIDSLLAGINSGSVQEKELTSIGRQKEVQEYDFRRPTRVSKDQLKTIRTIHENFAELFGFYLASKLQTMVTIELIALDQLRYSEYVLSISNPSCIFILDIPETEGRAVLELTPELVFVAVERLLGGEGNRPAQPRPITQIEQRIIQPVVQQALKHLNMAWKPVYDLSFQIAGFEGNPDFVQIAPASEIVLVASLEMKIKEDSFMMNICYPSFALEDVISQLNVQLLSSGLRSRSHKKEKDRIQKQLAHTPVEVRIILGRSHITIAELLSLEVGDVLRLDTSMEDDVQVLVEDKVKFLGRPGMVDDHLAVRITREVFGNEK